MRSVFAVLLAVLSEHPLRRRTGSFCRTHRSPISAVSPRLCPGSRTRWPPRPNTSAPAASATEALDRALHLAEFGTHAVGLAPKDAEQFRRGLEAVQEGRHALQNGRPEDAAGVLSEASEAISGADPQRESSPPPLAEHAEAVEGLKVLNQRGHHLGELEGFEDAEGGPMAVVAHGGFLWWGRSREHIPAEALLGSESFVVLPSPVEPREFGKPEAGARPVE